MIIIKTEISWEILAQQDFMSIEQQEQNAMT